MSKVRNSGIRGRAMTEWEKEVILEFGGIIPHAKRRNNKDSILDEYE